MNPSSRSSMYRLVGANRIVLLRLFLLAVPILLSSCSPAKPPPPKTYPVTGKVRYKGGDALPANSTIEFRSKKDPEARAAGSIDAAGSFSLVTLTRHGDRVDGAVEGEYEVIVTPAPPSGADSSDPAQAQAQSMLVPVHAAKLVVVEAKENNFPNIEVPKPPRP